MADVESLPAGESSVDLDDVQPADFWEKEEVAKQLAGFDGAKPVGETMAMLVAVRLRPLWAKVPRPPSLFSLSIMLRIHPAQLSFLCLTGGGSRRLQHRASAGRQGGGGAGPLVRRGLESEPCEGEAIRL